MAQRVNHLIRQGQFLKPEDYSQMPEYERTQMAREVIAFYGRLPAEIKRPFNEDFFGEDARKELSTILEDPERAEGLLSEMDGVLAALPLEFDRYEERAQILSVLHQYVDGTYTIFPEQKQEVEFTPVTGRQMNLFDFLSLDETQTEIVVEPETEEVQEESAAEHTEAKLDETVEAASYSREQGTFLYLDDDHLYQVERVSDSDVMLKDMENPSSAPLVIPIADYDGRLAENQLNLHLRNGANPSLKDSRCVYKECLYTMLEAVRQSEIYPVLRDRDTDEDMAVSIIREKVSELMAANSGSAPVFYEAGEHWEHFTDWMVEDIFQRTYQDYLTDSRDAVALYQNNSESPEWVRGIMVEASRQEIALPANSAAVENLEVVARFQSTTAMQDGYVENIAILLYPNGKFYNHYNYDEERGMGAASAGPFDSLEDARQTVLAHRPDAQEIDLQEIGTPEHEVVEEPHTAASGEPQMMPREAYAEYLSIKERYPNTLFGFETEGHYEFFGDDARMVSEILGSKLLDKPLESGGSVEVSGFPSGQWVYYSKKLWSQGENVYLAREQEDGSHATVKYLSGRDYLPIDATIHIDGREFRIDSVDYNRGMVSLQDMTMAKEARYPIFRNEPTEYVRSLYEEEEPQYDFATEETVFIAIQRSMYEYDDFSGEQMDVIYAAAEQGLNLKPMLNPEFSPAQMQLIADVEARIAAGEKVAYDGVMLPLSGHVMSPEEINAARREYHLPLDYFEDSEEEPEQKTDDALEPDVNEQRTGARVSGRAVSEPSQQERINFHITDDDLGAGGPKTKFRANIDAIRLLKELEAEGRLATAEEQEILSHFVGWGGIPQAVDAQNESWSSEYA